jgi:hypothetical protein
MLSRFRFRLILLAVLDLMFCLAIMGLYAGEQPPAINETHYLTKARHFWEPSFLAKDYFVDSANAHWFFFVSLGWLPAAFSFAAAAWIGRLLGWLTIAIGWRYLARSVAQVWWAGSVSLLPFLCALHFGHFSGEWVIGGFEAKCLAYGLAFFGIGSLLRDRFTTGWILLGLASAFHVLTGGWIVLCCLSATVLGALTRHRNQLSRSDRLASVAKQAPGLIVGGLISLLGLVPALIMNQGLSKDRLDQGYIIQVYARLGHHLAPHSFSLDRWLAFAGLLVVSGLAFGCYRRIRIPSDGTPGLSKKKATVGNRGPDDQSDELRPADPSAVFSSTVFSSTASRFHCSPESIAVLWWLASIAGGFAMVGIVIDFAMPYFSWPLAARLLRFYWFRFNDVAWPMALAMTLLGILSTAIVSTSPGTKYLGKTSCVQLKKPSASAGGSIRGSTDPFAIFILTLMLVPGSSLVVYRYATREFGPVSTSDLQAMGTPIDLTMVEEGIEDWIKACQFVKQSVPDEALVVTPRNQQNFKWYAETPEFFCFKDAPQNVEGLIEWRVRQVATTFLLNSAIDRDELTRRVQELADEFSVTHIVLDMQVHPEGLNLPQLYPLSSDENPSFAVYIIR